MTPEEKLEEALAQIRDEPVDPAVVEAASNRVWEKLKHAPLRNCEDFRALIPDYRAGNLSEARALLLKDHLRECIACRKIFEGRTAKVVALPAREPRSFRWAIAAGILVAAGLSGWALLNYLGPAPASAKAVVQAAAGGLYRISDQGIQPMAGGAELPAGAEMRTAKDSGAMVRLADGSQVEMRERSGLSVSASQRDLTIQLERGSIIVQAAKRRSGHLLVTTRDCKVSVTGSVFSVSSGMKGSRVSVIEGEVRVSQGNDQRVLHPGDQISTSPSLSAVPIQDEIAWSRNVKAHLALLHEFSVLQKRLEQVNLPGVRYHSQILGLLPPGTAVYASFPNPGATLTEVQQVFQQRFDESPELRQWWQGKMGGRQLEALVPKIRAFSDYLGDEIVIASAVNATGQLQAPVFLAEVKRTGFREFAQRELGALGDDQGRTHSLIRPDLVALSPDAGELKSVAARLDSAAHPGFADTPFGERISEIYRAGAGLVFAADLERIGSRLPNRASAATGFNNVKYLIVEQQASAGKTDTRATAIFRGPRRGIASWLARPAAIGALDFVSPEPGFVMAAVMKSPASILDEIAAWQETPQPRVDEKLGVNLRNDLAASLGGEFAVALDGPVIPVPSWKLAVEVYDPARLQWCIQKLVEAAQQEKVPLKFAQETAGGRTWYTIANSERGPLAEAHYVFVDGYLLAGPSRALLEQAIQYRTTGYTLPRSAAFNALLVRDRHTNFSAIVYQNLGPALAPLAGILVPQTNLDPQQRQSLQDLTGNMKPMLVTAYGDDDRITLASTGNLLGLSMNNLIGGNLLGLLRPMGIGGQKRGTHAQSPAYP